MSSVADQQTIVDRLVDLVEASPERAGRGSAPSGADSIRRVGLSAVSSLTFLVAVEDEFGIEWDDDVDEAVLASFDAMAEYLIAERAA